MIDKDQALQIARKECSRRRWPWNENTRVWWGLLSYSVRGGTRESGKLQMKIRKSTGEIVNARMSQK